MPAVLGTLARPDGTTATQGSGKFELVDQLGNPVRGFTGTKTIYGIQTIALDYNVTLTDNASISPANTYWKRTWISPGEPDQVEYLTVPTGGGPYQESAIAVGVTSLSVPAPMNELAYAEITADTGTLSLGALTVTAVPLLVITVPDISTPAYLHAHVRFSSTTANADVYAAFGPTTAATAGDVKGPYWANIGPTTGSSFATCAPFLRLPAHSPGTWQIFAGSNASISVIAKAAATAVSSIRATSA